MKSQSLIIQFILFFLIGLTLFTAIGSFFNIQSNTLSESIADANRKLINSYVTSIAISFFDACKHCDSVNITIKLKNTTAGYVTELALNSSGLNVFTLPVGKSYFSTIHNLNYTLTDSSGFASSTEPIILLLIKNQNKLRLIE